MRSISDILREDHERQEPDRPVPMNLPGSSLPSSLQDETSGEGGYGTPTRADIDMSSGPQGGLERESARKLALDATNQSFMKKTGLGDKIREGFVDFLEPGRASREQKSRLETQQWAEAIHNAQSLYEAGDFPGAMKIYDTVLKNADKLHPNLTAALLNARVAMGQANMKNDRLNKAFSGMSENMSPLDLWKAYVQAGGDTKDIAQVLPVLQRMQDDWTFQHDSSVPGLMYAGNKRTGQMVVTQVPGFEGQPKWGPEWQAQASGLFGRSIQSIYADANSQDPQRQAIGRDQLTQVTLAVHPKAKTDRDAYAAIEGYTNFDAAPREVQRKIMQQLKVGNAISIFTGKKDAEQELKFKQTAKPGEAAYDAEGNPLSGDTLNKDVAFKLDKGNAAFMGFNDRIFEQANALEEIIKFVFAKTKDGKTPLSNAINLYAQEKGMNRDQAWAVYNSLQKMLQVEVPRQESGTNRIFVTLMHNVEKQLPEKMDNIGSALAKVGMIKANATAAREAIIHQYTGRTPSTGNPFLQAVDKATQGSRTGADAERRQRMEGGKR